MKSYIVFLVFLSFFFISIVTTYGCKYGGKIDQCNVANENGNPKSIEDFVCILGTKEEIAFQVTLDMEFKDLDKEMDKYLEELEKSKNTYFGIDRSKTLVDGINDIRYKRNYFYKEYKDKCGVNMINIVGECNNEEGVSNEESKKLFIETDCMTLVDKKMEIFNDVSFSILLLNKLQIRTDEKKTYDQKERKNYLKLLDILNINIGYVERIWKKTPSLTGSPHH